MSAQFAPVRSVLIGVMDMVKPHREGWVRKHPFDDAHGVDTSGMVPGFLIRQGDPMDAPTMVYAGAQPSIVRAALRQIPDHEHCHFVDVGTGKGRPLFVATEFAFAKLTGVELSPALARMAQRNASAFARRFPDRQAVEVVNRNILAFDLPRENLVLFLYNPFDRPVVEALAQKLEQHLALSRSAFYLVYCNPTYGDVFDAVPALKRRYAAQVPYDAEEIGFGPDTSDAVVIWQNRGNPNLRPEGTPDAPIRIVTPGWRAEI